MPIHAGKWQIPDFSKALSGLMSAPNKALAYLDKIANLDDAKLREAEDRVARQMANELRGIIIESFSRAGLVSRTGNFLSFLNQCTVKTTRSGIWVDLPPAKEGGKTKNASNLYARAASWKFGYVRQPLTKANGSLYRDLSNGKMYERKKAAGELGEAAKKTLKNAVLNGQHKARGKYNTADLGQIKVYPPRKYFLRFSLDQIQRLDQKILTLVRAELNNMGVKI